MQKLLKPLWRHRLMPLLVVAQVALACALACNALFLLQQKLRPILAPDGVGDPQRLLVITNVVPRGEPWSAARLAAVGQQLRNIAGVSAVSVAGSLPMVDNARMNGDMVGQGLRSRANTAMYIGSRLVDTLGLKLVDGRNFSAAEDAVRHNDVGMEEGDPAIITRALAERLFPDGQALGHRIGYGRNGGQGTHLVVGVVEHLMRNDLEADHSKDLDYAVLLPGIPGQWPIPVFGVRVAQTGDVERVRKALEVTINKQLGNELVTGIQPRYELYATLRGHMLAAPRAAVWLLAGVSLVVLLVTLAGIMGLTGYWVQQRTRQIGIRRALGARRLDVLREIQLENLLVVGLGIALGMVLAYAVNLWLMSHYELQHLPLIYLPLGALLMVLLGQLAVWPPARRAAAVPPVVATRSL